MNYISLYNENMLCKCKTHSSIYITHVKLSSICVRGVIQYPLSYNWLAAKQDIITVILLSVRSRNLSSTEAMSSGRLMMDHLEAVRTDFTNLWITLWEIFNCHTFTACGRPISCSQIIFLLVNQVKDFDEVNIRNNI